MAEKVGTGSIVMMVIGLVIGVAVPLLLFVFFNRQKHASPRAFFFGWLAFLIGVNILEQMFHYLVYVSPLYQVLAQNLLLYGLYGGIVAGLFEELARYLCFSRFLKKEQENDWNALMYGAGHGGSELFNLFSMTMANNLIYAFTINSSGIATLTEGLSGADLEQAKATLDQLVNTTAASFLPSFAERIFALILQLSLSVLVFYAVKHPQRDRKLLLLAVELHALVDFLAVCISGMFGTLIGEIVVGISALGVAWFAHTVWKSHQSTAQN